jgi:lipoprotein-releasing system permease protein
MKIASFIARRFYSMSRSGVSGVVMNTAIFSVAVGVAVMIVSVSIVIGFKQQIREKVVGFVSHIQIESLDNNSSYEVTPITYNAALKQQLLDLEGVVQVQATAGKAGIIKTDEHIQGIVLKGIAEDFNWSLFERSLKSGSLIQVVEENRSDEVMISSIIARKLFLKTGDELRIWFVAGENNQPRGRKFTVAGVFETGLTEFDEMFVLADIRHVQRLNGWDEDQVGMVEVRIDDINALYETAESINELLPIDMVAYNVRQNYPHIFDWLDLQDMNVVVIILLLLMVAGITMVSTLLIIILERTSMIGILKAMGANNKTIRQIFLIHSTDILLRGLILGNLLGIGFCLMQLETAWLKLPAESYYLSEVPVYLNLENVLLINLVTLLIWMLMLLIPTAVINRITPSKAIRFS